MTLQSEIEPLCKVWKALASYGPREGWSTLEIWRTPTIRLLAGRVFPEGSEALLVGLLDTSIPKGLQLPLGRGFHLLRPQLTLAGPNTGWLALVRRTAGSEDLFSAVAEDVVALLRSLEGSTGRSVMSAVVERVRAWQAFMERERQEGISKEAELGLVGELLVMEGILDAGVLPAEALQAWQGPLDALQDFQLSGGNIEVKTTSRLSGFPATIHSLDQLDHTQVQRLYLAAVRVSICEEGATLPLIAARIRNRLPAGPEQAAFASRLIHAGLHPEAEDACLRRFAPQSIELIRVEDGFPALTRSDVARPVSEASYVLEVDQVEAPRTTLDHALSALGAL